MEEKYISEICSRNFLREHASSFRKKLNVDHLIKIPVVEILESLPFEFKGFNYEVVPNDAYSKEKHAETDVFNKVIRIKESVYDGACEGNGRDRMTIMHEIAHFYLIEDLDMQKEEDK